MRKQPTGLSKEVRGPFRGWGARRGDRAAASARVPSAQDFVEVCKREGGDHEEKGVHRLLGLGSSRCVARGWMVPVPRVEAAPGKGGGPGRSHRGLACVPAAAPQVEWRCPEKTRRLPSWGCRCSR